ncbi:hypothetical protein [Vreelandella utahensis]|uniref:hypothetical protein n=1 Tax=Vreelandella halophila TaxID=86177 RepID=UPI000984EAA7|nr:hypothetical protein [Halomonas utahensis]
MDDQNHIKSRRGLIILSVGLIIYFWAGGSLDENAVTLPLIGMNLEREWPVLTIAVIAFVFSLIRFLQFNLAQAKTAIQAATKELFPDPQLNKLAHKLKLDEHLIPSPLDASDSVEILELFRDETSYYIDIIPSGARNIYDHETGNTTEDYRKRVRLSGKNPLVIRAHLKAALLIPAFGDYIVPLLIALVAAVTIITSAFISLVELIF